MAGDNPRWADVRFEGAGEENRHENGGDARGNGRYREGRRRGGLMGVSAPNPSGRGRDSQGGVRRGLGGQMCASHILLLLVSLASCSVSTTESPTSGRAAAHTPAAPAMKLREEPLAKPKLRRSGHREDLTKNWDPQMVDDRHATGGCLAESEQPSLGRPWGNSEWTKETRTLTDEISLVADEDMSAMEESESAQPQSPEKEFGGATGMISRGIIDNGWDGCLEGYNPKGKGTGMGFESAWASLPHPVKAYRGGEDVQMACSVGDVSLIGVFDGVGGWADLGIDPALYAREMAFVIERELRANPDICKQYEKPLVELLQTAYNDLESRGRQGSCTVCLALVTGDGQLHVLNLGDSGLHVVRDGMSVFSTNEQQHYFNCPFQLGMGSDDTPADADYYILTDISVGDVIVLATDGVWDNVYEEDVVRLVVEGRCQPKRISGQISKLSQRQARDGGYMSPFAFSARRQGLSYSGGKLDDVTVVVARVAVGQGGVQGGGKPGQLTANMVSDEFISPVSSEEPGLDQDDADESWDDGSAGASGTGNGAKREAESGSFRDYLRWLKDGW